MRLNYWKHLKVRSYSALFPRMMPIPFANAKKTSIKFKCMIIYFPIHKKLGYDMDI